MKIFPCLLSLVIAGGARAADAEQVVIYAEKNAPQTPKLEELELKESVSRHGITWKFDKPAPAGQFVNGDWYVVGPVKVVNMDPRPLYGPEVKATDEDKKARGEPARNGCILNPSLDSAKHGFDSRADKYHPDFHTKLPVAMKPGDALAEKGLYGVFGADARTIGHPALLGRIHVDQPDQALNYPPEQRKKNDFVVPSYRVVLWAKANDPEEKDTPEELLLVRPAYRWFKGIDKSRPVLLTVGEVFFKALREGKKELCEGYLASSDAVGCKVPAGNLAEAVAKLRELAPEKPVFAWVETRGAKPEDIRSQVRTAIAKGAAAIGYRGFEGYGDEKPEAAVLAELKRINDLITAHAAELLADPARARTLL